MTHRDSSQFKKLKCTEYGLNISILEKKKQLQKYIKEGEKGYKMSVQHICAHFKLTLVSMTKLR